MTAPRSALVGEVLGTFLLVLFGTGSVACAVLTGALQGLWQVAVVWGFGVTIAIYCSAALSGAHLNPAVSLAFALLRQGQIDEAVTLLEAATRQNPNYDLSYSHLADARLAQNDTMGAVVALRRFLDVSVNQRDRAIAQQKLSEITTPRPVAMLIAA